MLWQLLLGIVEGGLIPGASPAYDRTDILPLDLMSQWFGAHPELHHGQDFPLWKSHPKGYECAKEPKEAILVGMPTIPRSGNTYFRKLLELSSGFATGNVWEQAERWEKCTDHVNTTYFDNMCTCGCINDCENVRQPKPSEPYVVKSHYPFLDKAKGQTSQFKTKKGKNVVLTRLIFTIRNPLDNFISWHRYQLRTEETLAEFIDAWADHFAFWFNRAADKCIQTTVIRYEDFIKPGMTGDVMEEMLRGIGYKPDKGRIQKALKRWPVREDKLDPYVYYHPELIANNQTLFNPSAVSAVDKAAPLLEQLGYGFLVDKVRELAGRAPTTEARKATAFHVMT